MADVTPQPSIGRRWMIPGGEEDSKGVTLFVVTTSKDGRDASRFAVRVPLSVAADGTLAVGEPEVVANP